MDVELRSTRYTRRKQNVRTPSEMAETPELPILYTWTVSCPSSLLVKTGQVLMLGALRRKVVEYTHPALTLLCTNTTPLFCCLTVLLFDVLYALPF